MINFLKIRHGTSDTGICIKKAPGSPPSSYRGAYQGVSLTYFVNLGGIVVIKTELTKTVKLTNFVNFSIENCAPGCDIDRFCQWRKDFFRWKKKQIDKNCRFDKFFQFPRQNITLKEHTRVLLWLFSPKFGPNIVMMILTQ